MWHNRLRTQTSFSLLVAAAVLYGGQGFAQAQNAQKSAGPTIAYAGVSISGYQKLTVSLSGGGIHLAGKDSLLELQEKGRTLHQLHADDIRLTKTGNGLEGELSGNVRYTQLNTLNRSKIIDGTAERALYKQSGAIENTVITLTKAHVSMFREGDEIATLNADQIGANPRNETVTGAGAIRIVAQVAGHRVEVTAEKILWDRHANTIEVSGKAHLSYTGPDKKTGTVDGEHITIDLKNLSFESK